MFTMILIVAGLLLLVSRLSVVVGTGLDIAGVRSEFFEAFDATPVHHQDLATRVPSTTKTENYGFLGTVPQMREWGTGRLAKGIRAEKYSVESQQYEATIEVDRIEIEDDQTAQIRMRIGELAERAKTHPDYLLGTLLVNGAESGFDSYDGVPYFCESHQSGSEGPQSNLLTFSAEDTEAPTQAEFRGALTQAIAQMMQYKDDIGEPKRIQPTGLVCIVPASMYFTALESINLQLVQTGANPFGANVIQNAARVISMPELTDPTKWFLLKTDVRVRPFIFQDRVPIEFQALEEGSEESFKRGKFLFGVRARYAVAYAYWQYAISTEFTGD